MTWKIPLSDIEVGDDEVAAVTKVLNSKWLSLGEVTESFERAFAAFLGVKYAFAVTSGTAALHLAYAALGLKAGDEVIMPSLTFVATANAAIYVGATPVFAEVNGPDDLNISAADIERRITPRTRAITPVHYGGYACDMDAILEVARRHDLSVIEDAAHAPGASYRGRKVGTLGDVACFSFFPNKNLTTAEGGMVVTNREELAVSMRKMRSHGMTSLTMDRYRGRAHSYDVEVLGYNYRIDEIRSAIGLAQLKRLESNNIRRREAAQKYRRRLADLAGLSVPFSTFPHPSSNHIFPVLLDDAASRGGVVSSLKADGIQTSIHYPPIHLLTYYRRRYGHKEGSLPLTEDACAREMTLPLFPGIREQEIEMVVNTLRRSLK